jgi:ABC-type multidrug transport system fused ATPase/permease subunit
MPLFPEKSAIHYLLHALKRSRSRVLIIFLLDLLAGLLAILLSLCLAQTIAVSFGFNSLRAQASGIVLHSARQGLLVLSLIIGVKLLCDFLRLYMREQLADIFIHNLRTTLFQHYVQQHSIRLNQKSIGTALLRFGSESGAVRNLLTRGLMQFAADVTLLLMGLAFIFYLNIILGLSILALLCIAWFITQQLNNRLKTAEAGRRTKKARLFRFFHDTLSQLDSIQALNRTTRVLQRFERHRMRLATAEQKYYAPAAWSGSLPWFWVQILLLPVLSGAVYLQTPPTAIFAIVLLMMSWRSPLSRLYKAGILWKKGMLSLQKINRQIQKGITEEAALKVLPKTVRQISFEQLSLRFGDKTVFESLSFSLKQGSITSLHIGIGEGKTAIAKLLAGVYTASAGRICVDGQDTRQFTGQSLRRQLTFVSEAFPLSGNNIADALSNSSKPEAIKNAMAAVQEWQQLFPALRELPPLAQLSSGQQMILQCLRAKLSNKPFWILDDPFSRLDAESAWHLEQILLESAREKGILLLRQKKDFTTAVTF